MPRIARKNLNTNYFHIIVQGINKEYVFNKNEYIEKYKNLLMRNLTKYDVRVIAYCIMNNHAHILLYTEKIEIMAAYMKSTNTSYAKYYNKKENRVGFVFRNRYESEPIYEQRYLLNCIAYIHNNPVKANIVDTPEKYKYSSYKDYINMQGIATQDTIKLVFGNTKDYLDIYKEIHKNSVEFKDYIKNIDYEEKYRYLKQMNTKDIILNKENLKKTIFELVIDQKIPINKVSELLEISRFKISRIIHEK